MRIRIRRGAAPPEAREIRRRVFVDEQHVEPHEEWDAHDEPGADTLHFVAYEGEHPLGCARLRWPEDFAKIERVAVLPEVRERGLGSALMEASETAAWRRGAARLRIHAQTAVIPFYEHLGWCALGPEFAEAGIPHRRMEKSEPRAAAGLGWRRLGDEGLRALVDEVAALPGVEAVVLGGSRARSFSGPGSDVDLGLLYLDAQPIDVASVRTLAARWNDAPDPVVSELYGWGPWVNGGAWLTVRGRRVDLLYRSVDRALREIEAARAGRHEVHFGQQPPFGFWSGTLLGECASALPLHDPHEHAERLRGLVAAYPEALRESVLRDALRDARFGLAAFAPKFAARGDAWGTAACLARAVWQLGLALFAWNRCYLVNDKTLLEEIEGFADAPAGFRARAKAALAAVGWTPSELQASLAEIETLCTETSRQVALSSLPASSPRSPSGSR